jgi:RHS repeat-associated protein
MGQKSLSLAARIPDPSVPRARLVLRLFAEASGGTVLHEQEDYLVRGRLVNTASWSWQQLAVGKLATVDCWAEVYVENLSSQAVWFDDLEIATGALPVAVVVQETHYDPWGLELAGIGYNAGGNPEHRWKFNGGVERTSDFGLHWDESGARMYDPQVPRFLGVDPLADKEGQESWTPYHYGFNNPARYNDPDGKCPTCLIGAIIGASVDYGFQVAGNMLNGKSFGEALTYKIDKNSIMISAVAGAMTQGLSAVGGKGAQFVITAGIDASESVAKQLNSKEGTVTVAQTVSDVVSNKIGGELTKKASAIVDTKILKREADRARNISAGDPTSKSRAKTAETAQKSLATAERTNKATGQAASGTVGNTIQNTSNVARSEIKAKPPKVAQADATNIAKPIRAIFPGQQ